MLNQLLSGGLVSLANFGIHAVMTGLIIVVTRHVAGKTDDLHVFMRVTALLTITVVALTVAHVSEISVWAAVHDAGRHHGSRMSKRSNSRSRTIRRSDTATWSPAAASA